MLPFEAYTSSARSGPGRSPGSSFLLIQAYSLPLAISRCRSITSTSKRSIVYFISDRPPTSNRAGCSRRLVNGWFRMVATVAHGWMGDRTRYHASRSLWNP
jgi:hypothetical protein